MPKDELLLIPGVGKSICKDLHDIGVHSIEDLKKWSPDRLYAASNQFAGCVQDRCLLYVFRLAIYYATIPISKQEPEKLKWWNWKDKTAL